MLLGGEGEQLQDFSKVGKGNQRRKGGAGVLGGGRHSFSGSPSACFYHIAANLPLEAITRCSQEGKENRVKEGGGGQAQQGEQGGVML